MAKKILIGLVAVVVIFLGVVSMQPATYHVERSIVIGTQTGTAWHEVSDFNKWSAWNPWEKEDPTQKNTHEGTAGTVGHKTSWVGEKTGKGSMTIVKADKPGHIGIKLEFKEPFASQADTAFDFKAEGDKTKVTWSMDGKSNFMSKLFGLLMGDMDKMIGPKYEEGLANLKKVLEGK